MSIATQTLQTLNAAFKVQYADKMKHLVPEMAPILSKVPFVKSNQKHGSVYIQPVVLSLDHGFTCHGPNDNNLMLNPPVGHIIQQANVTASAYSGRSWISYGALSRATGGDQAFIDETGHIVEALSRGFSHMIEGIHWYGQSGLGTSTAATLNLAAKMLTITTAASAAFLWLGAEGMPVDLYVSGAFVLSTEVTAVRIGATTADGGTTYTEDGGITLTLASVTGISNADVVTIYRKGFYGTEHAGIKKILSTDSIFGIDGSRYGMWRANRYTASAALSFSNLSLAIARSIGRGLSGPLMGFVSPKAFRQLLPDYVSLGELDAAATNPTYTAKGNAKSRRTSEESNLVHGTKSIKLIVDSVEVEIESTEFVKFEDGFFLDKASIIRVGSTGPTFSLPGLENLDYIVPRPDASAGEIRIFADEAPFCDSLNRNLIIQSITA